MQLAHIQSEILGPLESVQRGTAGARREVNAGNVEVARGRRVAASTSSMSFSARSYLPLIEVEMARVSSNSEDGPIWSKAR